MNKVKASDNVLLWGDEIIMSCADFLIVGYWARWARRLFILTFPISIPLWIVCMVGVMVIYVTLGIASVFQTMFKRWWW